MLVKRKKKKKLNEKTMDGTKSHVDRLRNVDKYSYGVKGSEIYMFCVTMVGKCVSICYLSLKCLNIVRKVIVGVLGSY